MASGDTWTRVADLKTALELEKQMNKSLSGYLNGVKKIHELTDDLNDLKRVQARLLKSNLASDAEALVILNKQISSLSVSLRIIKETNKETSILKSSLKGALTGIFESIADLPGTIKKIGGTVNGLGLFAMDKAIKSSALSMGVFSKQAAGFRDTISSAAERATDIGGTLEEIAQIQSHYSDEIGRAVQLTGDQLLAMNQISKATGLGAEGAAKLSAEMDAQGTSAESVRDYMEQTMNDAHSMGLNAGKVVKNIAGNIKMLNKYNFKNGAKGLLKMAETATKLGIEMDTVAPMAEKLFDIEGAVEMSAQLQVMGGSWAQLADPFKLMYQARNDMDGLTQSVAEAASENAKFNAEADGFDLSSQSMARLREIAKSTGIEYDKLVTMGKKAAMLKSIKTQINFSTNDPKLEEFVANKSFLKNGKAYIDINGQPKLMSQLGSSAETLIRSEMAQSQTLQDQADAAVSFDERITNFINKLKIELLPFIKGMEDELVPAFKNFLARWKAEGWGDTLKSFAKSIGTMIGVVGKFIVENPIKAALISAGAWLFTKGAWFLNGVILGSGFNSVVSGKGGVTGIIEKSLNLRSGSAMTRMGMTGGQQLGANLEAAASSKLLKVGGVITGLMAGYSEFTENQEKHMDATENAVRTTSKALLTGGGAWGGAVAGAALGAFAGPVGALVGAGIGGAIGAWGGGAASEAVNTGMYGKKVDDGVINFNPNDKFMKVNDGTMIAGTNVNGNNNLAKSIMASQAPGTSMSDYSSKKNQNSASTNINLSNLNVSGAIDLKLNGESASVNARELLNDAFFVREIAKKINIATRNAVSGTQNTSVAK
jgi:hypothetical protein